VVATISDILKPYGLLGSYPRKDQLSNAVLQSKLDGIRSMAVFMPVIFLAMAAMIQFIILRRMVKSQRTQVGVMKALGYSDYQIMRHYTVYALTVSVLGALLGSGLGVLAAGGISGIFAMYFNLPGGLKGFDLNTLVYAILLSLGIGIVAGLAGSRGVLQIQPAEAMRPEPPPLGSQSILEKWSSLWRIFSAGWKMTLRNIARNRGRFLVTMIGVMFAVGLLILPFFINDAINYIMVKNYYQGESYNLIVIITVLLPQFFVPKWWQTILHNNTSLFIANAMFSKRNVVVSILPFYLEDLNKYKAKITASAQKASQELERPD